MAKINRICCICKQGYSYCPRYNRDVDKPTWYFIFDGQNCHDIYEVCTQYRDKEIDAEKAYEMISKLDLSKIDNFYESTRLQIEEILKIHEESNKTTKVVAEEKSQKSGFNIANNTKNFKRQCQ